VFYKEVKFLAFAEIIIDISTTALDRIFTYEIPESLVDRVEVGTKVLIPFGKGDNLKSGYVINIKSEPGFDITKVKSIKDIELDADLVEGNLIRLAYWMKDHYGSTYIQALETVLPNNRKAPKNVTYIKLNVDADIAK
jgi:primosomal protein N' (replication factor Y)